MKHDTANTRFYIVLVFLASLMITACKSDQMQATQTPLFEVTATAAPTLTSTSIPSKTPTPQGQPQEKAPGFSRIAYAGANDALCIMAPEGEERQCFQVPAEGNNQQVRQFAWSPDGNWIAFLTGFDLVAINVQTGETQLLHHDENAADPEASHIIAGPAWSRDSARVAVILGREVYVFPLDTEKRYRFAEDAWGYAGDYDPCANIRWSPDGVNLLYLRGGKEHNQLEGLAASSSRTSEASKLVLPGVINYAISSDGAQIAYRLESGGIWRSDAHCLNEGSSLDCVAESSILIAPKDEPAGGLWNLRWSPKGDKILAQFHGSLYLIDAVTGEFEKIGSQSSYRYWPWSPDGSQLILAQQGDGDLANSQPYFLDITSGQKTFLAGFETFAKYRYFSWGWMAAE